MDADGYGYRTTEQGAERLITDIRTLSPAGVERAAIGWQEASTSGPDSIRAAEETALKAIETANRGGDWDALRRSLFGLTESGHALIAWRREHGQTGHRAEAAANAAALGLLAVDMIDAATYRTLIEPMAEALPWLLKVSASRTPDRPA